MAQLGENGVFKNQRTYVKVGWNLEGEKTGMSLIAMEKGSGKDNDHAR